MRLKSKLGKEFIEFIKGIKKPSVIILTILAVLLLIGGLFLEGGSERAAETSDTLAELCRQIDGVGRCETLINRDDDGRVLAVAVVCDGAESLSVKEDLYKLISSLYGVGYNRISVLKFSE